MSDMSHEKEETEIQMYGVSLAELAEDYTDFIKFRTKRVVDAFFKGLLNSLGPKAKIDVNEISEQMVDHLMANEVKPLCDGFKEILEKHLSIPDNIPTLESLVHLDFDLENSQAQLEYLKNAYADRIETYMENKCLIESLKRELAAMEKLEKVYADLQQQIAPLNVETSSEDFEKFMKKADTDK